MGWTVGGLAASAILCPQMWMSVNERIMQVVCMTVSTSLAITDAPAMMDSTWHMMDTTVWVSKGELWEGMPYGEGGIIGISHFPGKERQVLKKVHSHKIEDKVSLSFESRH